MGIAPLQSRPPFAGHSPDRERPLGGYTVLTGTFLSLCGLFVRRLRRSGTELPEHVPAEDLLLLAVATHKLSRMATRDRVTSSLRAPFTVFQDDAGAGEVREAARGHGLRRAIGELLVCPYCLGMWVATAFVAGLLTAPRATRWVAATFAVLTGSDALQIAYARAERLLDP
ncbi:MAG TPA: DUF1360 domain-containing protein [Solirubrobacteraceae bacterium]|nr:DUF1360 domain-containing protein [Solirubrobacteraceae bacterium]